MTLNHFGKFLVRLQALPLQAGFPVLEETPRPHLALVIPQLAKRFFQQVCRVQPLVRRQQSLQGTPAVQGQILVAGKQYGTQSEILYDSRIYNPCRTSWRNSIAAKADRL